MPSFLAHLPALAFSAHPDPMWVLECAGPEDTARRIVDVNAAAIAAYGYSRSEFLALDGRTLPGPIGAASLATADTSASGGVSRPAPGELAWHVRRTGKRFAVELHCECLERDGRSYRLVLARERRDLDAADPLAGRARVAVGEAERLLYSTFDLVSDGVVLFDADQRYRYFNARAFTLVGLSANLDLIGDCIWDRFPNRVGSAFHAAFLRVMASRQPESVVEQHPFSGLWLETRLYPAGDGGLTVLVTDVTLRHREAEVLAQRERDWRQLAEQVPAIIYRSQAQAPYHTLWINPRIQDLGYTQAEWIADSGAWARLLHPDDVPRVMNDLLGGLAANGHAEIEYRMRDGDGLWRWFRDASRVVDSHDGREQFIQGVMFDITQARASEAALQASRAEMAGLAHRLLVQEKDTTRRLALALHDGIGQTLSVARLFLGTALARTEAAGRPDAGQDLPDVLEPTARRVDALLSTAIAEVRQTLEDLRPPLLDEQGLLAALDNEVRSVQPPGSVPSIQLEAPQIHRATRWPVDVEYGVFMVAREALSNAIRHAQSTRIVLRLDGAAQWLRLEVSDDGSGFLEARTPTDGPGSYRLGVNGMRERASAIGAQLTVEPATGGGSRVALHWAEAQPAAAAPR